MEEWKRTEFLYAKRLRECGRSERSELYREAYSRVAEQAAHKLKSDDPEDRTAGTSKRAVGALLGQLNQMDSVLEIGCGRGYTCMMLAPHVASIVGTDVSEAPLAEAEKLMVKQGLSNAKIEPVSALSLGEHFLPGSFSVCLSIDVVEHLHPEDAIDHLRQVFDILAPGGRYFIIMPNRINGPHDITREEFPDQREPMGFHLNEMTNRELITSMKAIGYAELKTFIPLALPFLRPSSIVLPASCSAFVESCYRPLPRSLRYSALGKLIGIRMIGRKLQ